MGQAYNRGDLIGSMQASMASEAGAQGSGGDSADSATTAGGKTSEQASAESSAGEGGQDGADESEGGESGSHDSNSEDGTADGDEGKSTGEKASEEGDGEAKEGEGDEPNPDDKAQKLSGKWEEEEAKDLKTWGLDKLGVSEDTRKLLKIARDNHTALQEAKQAGATLNDHLAAVGNAIVNHDLETLNTMAEELGGEKLPFDLRTEEDQIKDITDRYNEVFDSLEKGLKDQPEVWAAVQLALAPAQKKTEKAIEALERRIDNRKEIDEQLKKRGVEPVKGKYLEGLKAKSDKNFAELFKSDAKAKEYMEILKPIFKMGTVFQSPHKAYAMAPKEVNELGEALHFKRKFKEVYLPAIREQILAEAKLKKGLKPPPSGKRSDSMGAGDPPKPPDKNHNHNHFAGARLLQRFGR